ncbi:MAG: hypothetical protein L0338_03340, partial [Acidobacteria bacterium]|nr:hypothetical protein [Acidobacteriota bacterium]
SSLKKNHFSNRLKSLRMNSVEAKIDVLNLTPIGRSPDEMRVQRKVEDFPHIRRQSRSQNGSRAHWVAPISRSAEHTSPYLRNSGLSIRSLQ